VAALPEQSAAKGHTHAKQFEAHCGSGLVEKPAVCKHGRRAGRHVGREGGGGPSKFNRKCMPGPSETAGPSGPRWLSTTWADEQEPTSRPKGHLRWPSEHHLPTRLGRPSLRKREPAGDRNQAEPTPDASKYIGPVGQSFANDTMCDCPGPAWLGHSTSPVLCAEAVCLRAGLQARGRRAPRCPCAQLPPSKSPRPTPEPRLVRAGHRGWFTGRMAACPLLLYVCMVTANPFGSPLQGHRHSRGVAATAHRQCLLRGSVPLEFVVKRHLRDAQDLFGGELASSDVRRSMLPDRGPTYAYNIVWACVFIWVTSCGLVCCMWSSDAYVLVSPT
jgi:hypothetical protein